MRIAGSKVLVTGGAGFIGGHLVEALVRRGARVRVFDDFSSGLRDNLAAVRDDVEVIEGNVLDADAVRRATEGCDVVSHQAAQLEITHAIDDPLHDLQVNTVGTLHVLDAARRAGVGKVLNASSACVYGQTDGAPSVEDRSPTRPNWAYGVSKLAAESYGRIWAEHHRLPVVSFRYAIVYGEREWYGRVLTLFLKRALDGKPPIVFGAGDQVRDFVHVDDVVRLQLAAIESDAVAGEVLNASTAIGTTIAALAALVCAVTGRDLAPRREEVPVGARSTEVDGRMRLPSELQTMLLARDKAERLLGWKPAIALRDGVAREWAWLQANRQRWTRMSY